MIRLVNESRMYVQTRGFFFAVTLNWNSNIRRASRNQSWAKTFDDIWSCVHKQKVWKSNEQSRRLRLYSKLLKHVVNCNKQLKL